MLREIVENNIVRGYQRRVSLDEAIQHNEGVDLIREEKMLRDDVDLAEDEEENDYFDFIDCNSLMIILMCQCTSPKCLLILDLERWSKRNLPPQMREEVQYRRRRKTVKMPNFQIPLQAQIVNWRLDYIFAKSFCFP